MLFQRDNLCQKEGKAKTEMRWPVDIWSFPRGSVVKNLSANEETWVQSLGQEDPLEKEMATHCSILA